MARLSDASRTALVVATLGVMATTTSCALWADDGEDEHLHAARQAKQAQQLDAARLHAEAAVERGEHTARAEEILAAVVRARADEAYEQGLYRRAHRSYLDAADYEPASIRRARDLDRAFEAGLRVGLDDGELLELAERLLQYHSDDLEVRREAARLAEDLGDFETAADHYRWLLAADATDTDIALRLGIAYLATDRPDEAVSVLQRTYQHNPDHHQVAINLANAYQRTGRVDHALEVYDDLLERNPDHPGILRRSARLHRQIGNEDRARQLMERAAEASPGVEDRQMRPLE